jgi:hypothetical protein
MGYGACLPGIHPVRKSGLDLRGGKAQETAFTTIKL